LLRHPGPHLSIEHAAHDFPLEGLLPQGPSRRGPEEVDGDPGERVLQSVLHRQDPFHRDDRVVDLEVLGVPAHLARFLPPIL
jgi:hypothetical protein